METKILILQHLPRGLMLVLMEKKEKRGLMYIECQARTIILPDLITY